MYCEAEPDLLNMIILKYIIFCYLLLKFSNAPSSKFGSKLGNIGIRNAGKSGSYAGSTLAGSGDS